MSGAVAGRLEAARRACFVGRADELELFEAALHTDEPPFTLLLLHGSAEWARPHCCTGSVGSRSGPGYLSSGWTGATCRPRRTGSGQRWRRRWTCLIRPACPVIRPACPVIRPACPVIRPACSALPGERFCLSTPTSR
jgi:hypothetical protein